MWWNESGDGVQCAAGRGGDAELFWLRAAGLAGHNAYGMGEERGRSPGLCAYLRARRDAHLRSTVARKRQVAGATPRYVQCARSLAASGSVRRAHTHARCSLRAWCLRLAGEVVIAVHRPIDDMSTDRRTKSARCLDLRWVPESALCCFPLETTDPLLKFRPELLTFYVCLFLTCTLRWANRSVSVYYFCVLDVSLTTHRHSQLIPVPCDMNSKEYFYISNHDISFQGMSKTFWNWVVCLPFQVWSHL